MRAKYRNEDDSWSIDLGDIRLLDLKAITDILLETAVYDGNNDVFVPAEIFIQIVPGEDIVEFISIEADDFCGKDKWNGEV